MMQSATKGLGTNASPKLVSRLIGPASSAKTSYRTISCNYVAWAPMLVCRRAGTTKRCLPSLTRLPIVDHRSNNIKVSMFYPHTYDNWHTTTTTHIPALTIQVTLQSPNPYTTIPALLNNSNASLHPSIGSLSSQNPASFNLSRQSCRSKVSQYP